MMKKKGKLWVVEADKPKLRINPSYGWGWHHDPEGRLVMFNPTPHWMKTRLGYFLRMGESWWKKENIQSSVEREFRLQFAHKKKASWDMKTGAYIYKDKKSGKTYTV